MQQAANEARKDARTAATPCKRGAVRTGPALDPSMQVLHDFSLFGNQATVPFPCLLPN